MSISDDSCGLAEERPPMNPALVRAQGDGRIVTTTSSTVFGLPEHVTYGAAKGAILGFTGNLATESLAHGIRVNAIAPSAVTRMLPTDGGTEITPEMIASLTAERPVELVPPAMAVLAHESCPLNGEVPAVGRGRVSRYLLSDTRGREGGPALAPEDVREHLGEILDPAGADAWADVHASVVGRLRRGQSPRSALGT